MKICFHNSLRYQRDVRSRKSDSKTRLFHGAKYWPIRNGYFRAVAVQFFFVFNHFNMASTWCIARIYELGGCTHEGIELGNDVIVSRWRCILNRQWCGGRIYSSSKWFEILFFIESCYNLQVLSSLCVCIAIGTDTGTLHAPAACHRHWCWRWLAWSPVHALHSSWHWHCMVENWWTQCKCRSIVHQSIIISEGWHWMILRCDHSMSSLGNDDGLMDNRSA